MWLVTRDGFFSVVQHDEDSQALLVRGRVHDDLDRLRKELELMVTARDLVADGTLEVVEDRAADYRFRMRVPRSAFGAYVLEQALEIDYTTNVKGTISSPSGTPEPDRSKAYVQMWQAGYDLQTRRARGAGASDQTLQEEYDAWWDDQGRVLEGD